MGDETEHPVDELEAELSELDGVSVADIDSLDLTTIGGLHLDRAWQTVREHIDYGRDPVRVIIEPETPNPNDHHYRMEIEDLEFVRHDEIGEYRPADSEARLRRLADVVRQMDCLVPCEIDGMDDVGVYPNESLIMFEAEADVLADANRTGNPQYRMPAELRYECQKWDASITEAAFNPEGDGWGEPTYSITIELDT